MNLIIMIRHRRGLPPVPLGLPKLKLRAGERRVYALGGYMYAQSLIIV